MKDTKYARGALALRSAKAGVWGVVLIAMLCVARVAGQNNNVILKSWPLTFQEIVWCNTDIAFINADEGLWRSVNEGQDWKQVVLDGTSSVDEMYQDVADPTKVLFTGSPDNVGWTTSDAGQTFTKITFPWSASTFIPHPNKSGWMLALVYDRTASEYMLYVSTNFAQSWALVTQLRMYPSLAWGTDNTSPNTIFYINKNNDFGYTNDFGKSFSKIYEEASDFAMTSHHLFVAIDDPKNLFEYNLMVSSGPYTQVATYFEAQFPFGEDLPQSYTLLDDTTGAEWLGVVMDSKKNDGTLYTSGSDGLKYTTTLEQVYQQQGLFDFDVFHGLEGIYITNTITSGALQTRITFDNGASWQGLVAPKQTWRGTPISCTGACGLHLHGINDWLSRYAPPYYSSPNAIGLLIGTGNVGTSLESTPKNTYLSRDAGRTWTEILGGSYIYEMGDHGGILVFAYLSTSTTQVYYSLDEGLTIQSFDLGQSVDIYNIIAEPSGTGQKFVLYGIADSTDQGVVYGLDFSNAQNRTCVDADYESWSPRANEEACLLGRNVTYSRRKQSTNCFNTRDYEHSNTPVNCPCTADDYECDFGFVEQPGGAFVCTLGSGVSPQKDPPDYCPSGSSYTVSKGYRRVAGDSCATPSSSPYEPVIKTCPKKGDGSSHGGVVAAVVIMILVAFGVVGFLIYRNDEWRERVLAVVGKVIPISSSGGARYGRLGGMRPGSLADEEFGIGGEHDLDDSDVEEDAPVLQDNDIIQATSLDREKSVNDDDDFNPRG